MHSTFATRWLLQTDVEAHGPSEQAAGPPLCQGLAE